jgi:hypothetical protein
MVCLYKNILFHVKEIKLGMRQKTTFIEITDMTMKEIIEKYKKKYPNDSFREYGRGQGIPTYTISSALQSIKEDEEYLNALKLYERDKNIEDIL